MSRVSAPWRQTGRITSLRSRRLFAVAIALGVTLAGGIPTAAATQPDPVHKDYVCKYIGKPGVDERLQTGNNPIWVDTAATSAGFAPDLFNDRHRSYVIVANSPKLSPEPGLGACGQPVGPPALVVVTTENATTCTEYKVRDKTVTTPYVLNALTNKWKLGTVSTTVVGEWVISTPTDAQTTAAGLVCPSRQPDAKVVVTTENATTCTEYKARDKTVTTSYVLNEATNKWELGTVSTTVVGKWVISKPTAAQIQAAGLTSTCKGTVVVVTDNSGGVKVEAAKPVVAAPAAPVVTETSDGVQIPGANPLPSAARAGDADTGGQLAAGGLAGIGALLAMGAGFVLRRREGEV